MLPRVLLVLERHSHPFKVLLLLRLVLSPSFILAGVGTEELFKVQVAVSCSWLLLFRGDPVPPSLWPIAGIDFIVACAVAPSRPRHINAKGVLWPGRVDAHHVDAWEGLGVDLHGVLSQFEPA